MEGKRGEVNQILELGFSGDFGYAIQFMREV